MPNFEPLSHQEGGHVVHQDLHGGVLPQRHPEHLDY